MKIICTEKERDAFEKEISLHSGLSFCRKTPLRDCFNMANCVKCFERHMNIEWEITN